jgi:hypothetical protein
VQRKTLCVFASLRANFFFFSQSRKGAKKLDKPLALWYEFNCFFGAQRRRGAKKLERTSATYLKQAGFSLNYFLECKEKPFASSRLCALTSFFSRKAGKAQRN